MRTTIPNLRGLENIPGMVFSRFLADNCLSHAAALTYTTLFAIVPLLTVTYSMLASFPSFQGVGEQLQSFIFSNFLPSTGETISKWLTSFSNQARNLTLVGMGFLVITALMMLRTIDHAINAIFHAGGGRSAVHSLMLYWAILTLGPILLGLGFAATSYLTTVTFIDQATSILGVKRLALRLMPILFSTMAFTLLYVSVPNRRVRLRHGLAGGVVVALMFELAKWGFTLFLALSPTYAFIYGAFAAVPIFLIWIFLSWLLVLFGAELVHALGEPRSVRGREISPVLSMLAVLSVFHQRFQLGQATVLEDVQDQNWPVSQRRWEEITSHLREQGALVRSLDGRLMPGKLFSAIPLAELVENSPWPMPTRAELSESDSDGYPEWFVEMNRLFMRLTQERAAHLSGSLTDYFPEQTLCSKT